MRIRIGFDITIECKDDTPLLLALSPRPEEDHRVVGSCEIQSFPQRPMQTFFDEYGNRRTRLVAGAGKLRLRSDCVVEDSGLPDAVDWSAEQHPVEALPVETLGFLSASRYCEVDMLTEKAWELFGKTPAGWPRIQAIGNFVQNHITFGYEFAHPSKTAAGVLTEGRGVCRDFAHLFVTFCRAMNIPARYASGYLSDIGVPVTGPGDFCAWCEVFLGGRWHTFDARFNTPRIGRVLMVRGRDAADVAMVTAFGDYTLTGFEVWTDEVAATGSPSVDRPAAVLASPSGRLIRQAVDTTYAASRPRTFETSLSR
jgi:transglutaminase-like putative cysteine protease